MAFVLRRAKVLGLLSVQLVSKISNLCDPDPPTLQTDRETDRRHCDLNTALCTIVHHAVKIKLKIKKMLVVVLLLVFDGFQIGLEFGMKFSRILPRVNKH